VRAVGLEILVNHGATLLICKLNKRE